MIIEVLMLTLYCLASLVEGKTRLSPRPSLEDFRKDYVSVAQTCHEVGFIKGKYNKGDPVAFHVKLTKHFKNLVKGSKLIYESIETNVGEGYNSKTGIFTAPRSGKYVFDWAVMSFPNKVSETTLMVNGVAKDLNYCKNVKTWPHCSKMTIVNMNAGDLVWIAVSSDKANVHSGYTTFSGFRL
ncbi:uncharacterized protein LOC134278559 [Saccostrea cucullata]|uniref:uncharacterized protein LOC134278559 n=1 Tax=Saccostrea cuccullata TaxID=36930 RepID=UPI002ED31F68